jgi:S-adenosylmethionine/arginine decarboxylase-like enzyme
MQANAGIVTIVNAVVDENAAENLNNFNWVRKTLYKLADVAKMHVLTDTHVAVPCSPEKVNTEEDDGGISVTLIISTSSIHIHTWPLQKRFRLVLDSCKDYDVNTVKSFVRREFRINGEESESWQVMPYQFPLSIS